MRGVASTGQEGFDVQLDRGSWERQRVRRQALVHPDLGLGADRVASCMQERLQNRARPR